MDVFECLKQRYSYRGEYRADPVSRETLRKILQAGLDAPSGCNCQTTTLVAVDDFATLEKIAVLLPRISVKTCPAAVFVFARRQIAYDDRTFFVQDYSAAIENMLLAIQASGLASCWLEGAVTGKNDCGKQIARLLDAPEDVELVAMLPVGVPAEETKQPVKQAFEERAWFGAYGKIQ